MSDNTNKQTKQNFNKDNNGNNKKKGSGPSIIWIYGTIFLVFIIGTFLFDENNINKEVNFTTFCEYAEKGGVKDITVYSNSMKIEAELTDSMANTLFDKSQLSKADRCLVVTKGPSADKVQEKIDELTKNGFFKGCLKFEE